MEFLDVIFTAYYSVVPLETIAGLISMAFLVEFLYTFTNNWEVG